MEFAFKIFLVLQVLVSVLLILAVVAQKTTDEGMIVSSGSNSFLSSVEVVDIATKITRYLAVSFVILTLALAALSVRIHKQYSLLEQAKNAQSKSEIPIE
jgi:protein translocase SecG subunit